MSSTTPAGQVDHFVNQTQNVEAPDTSLPDGQTAPRVPFQTAYKLTGAQEQILIDHAMRRLREMENELGRVQTEGVGWFQTFLSSMGITWRTFMGKRFIYDQVYHNEVEWRRWLLGGIFAKVNYVVPITRRICRQMVARANNYFFATDPWVAAYPMGEATKPLATKLDRWTQWKFGISDLKHVLELATELAFVRGETVVKTTWEHNAQIFESVATVLEDSQGMDILDANKDYIFNTDVWVPQMTEPQTDPGTGLAVPVVATGGFVLKRDMKTPKPAPQDTRWVTKKIKRRRIIFKGARSEIVYYRDFLAPLNAADIQTADCICHLRDMPVMNIIDAYMRKGLINLSADEENEAMRKAIAQIRILSSSSGIPKSAEGQPRPELNQMEYSAVSEASNPVFQLAEFYLTYDANGDGIMENILLVLDRQSETPFFYDYVSNVTPDGERPFDVLRISEIDGRWYGIGVVEMFETSQETIDLLVNRWMLSQSEAGRVTFFRSYLTQEGDSNKNLQFNNGRVYTPKPGVKIEDILTYVTLPDIKHADLKDSFEFYMQLMTNESGVANANDSQVAGLQSSELATGVRNIEKSGQEMFAVYLSPLERGHTNIARRNMRLELDHIDGDETFVFFEGDQAATDVLMEEDAQSVVMDVQILLTRYRGEQVVQSTSQAANATVQFYSYPTTIQPHVAEFYRDMLNALQVQNSDKIIVPGVGQLQQGGGGQPGAPGQSGTPAGMPSLNPQALTQAVAASPSGQAPPNL